MSPVAALLLWPEQTNNGMSGRYKVLFLCTGNSARSIMAEAILNHKGKGKFDCLQRGQSSNRAAPRPEALQLIESAGLPTSALRSKSWDEFSRAGRVASSDFVFTVCDNAAKERVPLLAGTADDSALGYCRPGGGQGNSRRDHPRISRRFHCA